MRPRGKYPSVRMHPGGSYPSEKMWPSRFHPTEFHPSGFHPNDIHPSGFHQNKKVRPSGNFMHLESQKEWHVKSPSVAAVESGKGKEKIDFDSLILGTETFTINSRLCIAIRLSRYLLSRQSTRLMTMRQAPAR